MEELNAPALFEKVKDYLATNYISQKVSFSKNWNSILENKFNN